MGNSNKKQSAKCEQLTPEEQKCVINTFRNAARSDKMRSEDIIVSGKVDAVLLERHWSSQTDPRLGQFLTNFLFGCGPNKEQYCDYNRFVQLYIYNVRGTVDEKTNALFECLGQPSPAAGGTAVPYQLLREYCESIVSTYIRVVKASNHPNSKMWIAKGFRTKANYVQCLGETVASSIAEDQDNPAAEYSSDTVARWLMSSTLLASMSEVVLSALYGVARDPETAGRSDPPSLLPFPDGIAALPEYPAFVDLSHVVWLNQLIPHDHRHKWRFLFSSHVHGQSFSTMAGRIQDVGPTVVIIEDNAGYIFGGFASEPWRLSPDFYGNDRAFLFTLAPKMRVYPATSFNNHYQYMNFQTKTLPNGLMMGGQFDFGGIWVNADPFGSGYSTDSCSTFRGYKRLSKDSDFQLRSIEVWGVGDKPLSVKESVESVSSTRSVLDSHSQERKFLQMCGKEQISDGYRC